MIFNGHLDIVSGEGMEIEPFSPKFESGKVYGRGSIDMKAGIAGMIMAVESLITAKIELKGDLIVSFVVDEEYESAGIEAFLKDYKADSAIVCEPTNLGIGIAQKGFAWIKVDIFGKSAHGSRSDKGIDAIEMAGKFICETEIFVKEFFKKKKHEFLGSPSLHFSLIKGGRELSTYPEYCEIKLERRVIPGEDKYEIEREFELVLKRISKKEKNFRGNFDIFFFRPPSEISKEEKIVKCLEKAYRMVK
ncbi:MAG: M20/M25/M40 family metallo-hydrolase [Candidatus Aminicenantia bacterium]